MRRKLQRTLRAPLLGSGVSLSLVLVAPAAGAYGYVFSTFKNDTPAGEKLSIYTSPDALNFTLLSDTGFGGPSGNLRDPSIMKHVDGKYYIAYTDPIGAGCCAKVDHFSIASSADLVHWNDVTMVNAGVAGVAHTWAPEWFIEGGTVNVIANIDTLNTDSDFKPYVFTATNGALTSWSGPVPLGFGPNYIDTFVLKVGTTYHAFAKNETTRFCEHATAARLTGPWTFVATGDFAGWGAGMEGPTVVRLDDGTWRIFMDAQFRPTTSRFLTATSPDLKMWSAAVPVPGLGALRHGTVIRDVETGGPQGDAGAGTDGTVPTLAPDAAAVDAGPDATLSSAGPDAEGGGANAGGDDAGATGPGDGDRLGGEATLDGAPAADASPEEASTVIAMKAGSGDCACHPARGRGNPRTGFILFILAVLAGRFRRQGHRGESRAPDRGQPRAPA